MRNFVFRSWPFVVLAVMALLVPNLSRAQCDWAQLRGLITKRTSPPTVVQGFIKAMRTTEENARNAAVRQYLGKVIETADWRTKADLRRWLDGAFAIVDPTPYEDLMGELGSVTLLDMAEFRRNRDLELEILGRALNQGRAYLPRGTVIGGNQAVIYSAEYGLEELKEDVAGFYSRTWTSDKASPPGTELGGLPDYAASANEDLKGSFPFKTFLLDLKLHEGGKDYDECARLAAKRLAEMPAQEFRDHIENDPGFSGVFWNVAMYACAVNVFTGEQNDACEDIMLVYVHQMWLYRDLKKAGKLATWPRELNNLGGCVYKDLLFGEYGVVPRDLFMTPEHKKRLERTRERQEAAREAAKRKKVAAGQTVR